MPISHVQVIIASALYTLTDSERGLPKSLVEIDGKSVLHRALQSYSSFSNSVTVAINSSENSSFDIEGHIKKSIENARVVEINNGVKGAMASALLCLEGLDLGAPLLIAGGNSEIEGGVDESIWDFVENGVDGGTIVFRSQNPGFSYVSVDALRRPSEVAEKRVISELATTGVFYFAKAGFFLEACEWVMRKNSRINGMFYNSLALNYMIFNGMEVTVHEIPASRYRKF